jgi:AraC-like DNA-binding protein
VPHVDIAKRALPGLEFFTGVLSGVRQTARPEGQPHTGHDELFLWLNVAGDSLVRRGGEERTTRGGNAFVASRGRAGFTILSPNRVRFLGMRMPRAALIPLIAEIDTERLRAIPRDKVALRMLTTYATGVASEAAPLCGEPARAFVTHIYDLVALAIGPTADCTSIAEGRGLRAARLHRIKSDVLANLQHCGIKITDVAGRHGITPRYVHKLFESDGVTFTEFLRNQRLTLAYRMLTDARLDDRSISSIAYGAGFGDLSNFNHLFRRRYGARPSDIRNCR